MFVLFKNYSVLKMTQIGILTHALKLNCRTLLYCIFGVVSLLRQSLLRHSLILRPCIPDCIIISYLIATPNNYRIIAQSGYWKYDHECRKTHQIKRVCGTCYAHEFNLNAFRHEWSYFQYSRWAIDYYIYFIDENKRYSQKFRWTMFSVFRTVRQCLLSDVA